MAKYVTGRDTSYNHFENCITHVQLYSERNIRLALHANQLIDISASSSHRTINRRRLSESIFHSIRCNDLEHIKFEMLFNYEWLQAKLDTTSTEVQNSHPYFYLQISSSYVARRVGNLDIVRQGYNFLMVLYTALCIEGRGSYKSTSVNAHFALVVNFSSLPKFICLQV